MDFLRESCKGVGLAIELTRLSIGHVTAGFYVSLPDVDSARVRGRGGGCQRASEAMCVCWWPS
jgi:hypothetical protein